ncbi:MAG: acyl carrier protein [Bacteroidetes bacterium]|nr:acyl carrier protein [Bacteroidota bacterium]
MEEFLTMVQSVNPNFKLEDLDKPFNIAGIESMDLVVLRVSFEKKFGRVVPTSTWLNFTTILQIIEFYKT